MVIVVIIIIIIIIIIFIIIIIIVCVGITVAMVCDRHIISCEIQVNLSMMECLRTNTHFYLNT